MMEASRPNAMASVEKSSPIRYLINQVLRQKMLNYSCNWCTDLKKKAYPNSILKIVTL